MSIAFRRVEEQIQDLCSRDVRILGRNVGEDDPRCRFFPGPGNGCLPKVLFAEVGKAEEPEDGIRNSCQDA